MAVRKASFAGSVASEMDDKVHYFNTGQLQVGDNVWIPTLDKKDWEYGEVIELNDEEVDAIFVQRTANPTQKPYFGRKVFPGDNPFKSDGHSDMTSMKYINEPQILQNLEVRSLQKMPYTLMGPVLISVNPLVDVPEPAKAGDPKVLRMVHPYAVAELSLNQMRFTISRPEESVDAPPDQTIIVSGESGSGKTVNSRKLLDHLVKRSGGGDALAKAMLGANPILESFGNAKTLRNPNSSRFGRMMKLHFDPKGDKITGASIVTYLLERSRISTHELGERGYHIFYEILSSGDSKLLGATKLDPNAQYNNLLPREMLKDDAAMKKLNVLDTDKGNFKATCEGLMAVGMDESKQMEMFKVVAAVAHMSQVVMDETDGQDGLVAKVRDGEGKAALGVVGELLGLDPAAIETTLTTREIGQEKVLKKLDRNESRKNLDGVMKALYSSIFQYIVSQINLSIKGKLEDGQPTIGVLDIFGFETFAKNDFEQLLINYTNEALQQVFNKQVLEREADLYKSEGLSMSIEDQAALDPSVVHDAKNAKCILLFEGATKKTDKGTAKKYGILDIIHIEGGELKPSDIKMLQKVNAAFNKKEYKSVYVKGKKQDKDKRFRVRHYASTVTYTVGNFLDKNNDKLPKSVNELFGSSSSEIVKEIWDCGNHQTSNKRNAPSISSKFSKQIKKLTGDLDATQCSFIRCIKPNPRLESGDGWFYRSYVMRQIKNLSISKTADILKSGLPTRIPYDQLVGQFKGIIEKENLPAFYTTAKTESETKTFIAALFYAFEIERSSYKLGLTKVFFKTGELEKLETVLGAADAWSAGNLSGDDAKKKDEVIKNFKAFHMKRRWGVFFSTMEACGKFLRLLKKVKTTNAQILASTVLIQSVYRGYVARKLASRLLEEKLQKEREEAEKKRAEEEAKRIREEEERARQVAEDLLRLKREMAEEAAREKRREEKLEAMRLALIANEKKREQEKLKEEQEAEELAKQEAAKKKDEEEMAKQMAELQAMESQRKAQAARRKELEKKKREQEAAVKKRKEEQEEAKRLQLRERSKLYAKMEQEKKKRMRKDEATIVASLKQKNEDTNEVANMVIENNMLVEAQKRENTKEEIDDETDDEDEVQSVGSQEGGGTKDRENYEVAQQAEEEKAATKRTENEIVGVKYEGPFQVSFNRYELEKSEQSRSGRAKGRLLYNRLRKHWERGFIFAYPNDQKLLLSLNATTSWKFGIVSAKDPPKMTPLSDDKHQNQLVLENLTDASRKDVNVSALRKLIISFEDRDTRKEFQEHIKSWTEEKAAPVKPTAAQKKKRGSVFNMLQNAEVLNKIEVKKVAGRVVNGFAKLKGNWTKEQMAEVMNDQQAENREEEDSNENDDEEDMYVFCTACATQYNDSELKGISRTGSNVVAMCPKGHEIIKDD